MTQTDGQMIRVGHRLTQARRAWKRTAALSGLVVVVSEVGGLVGVAVLADVLFSPERTGRVILLGGAVAATAFLTARHILAPLWRKITDKQMALYLEERDPGFEGALIAAVEFGPEHELSARQSQIIQSILHEAVVRAERFDLRKALDLRRFRKYGIVAVVMLGAYLTVGLALPDSVGKHVSRVVAPWKATTEEVETRQKLTELNKPITFTLSRQDTSLLRGGAFDLDATLSRKPPEALYFHFRAYDPKSSSAQWKRLPMKEAERLNGYRLALPDVNEDLEFFVAAGEHKSAVHRINVYDPLAIQKTQITTHYPDYLKRADETVQASSPDVTAVIGSTVTVRLDANLPLKEGTVTWQDGKTASMKLDKANPLVAEIGFEVKANTAYQYKLVDVNGQELPSPGAVTIQALVDKPPTIKLLTPDPMVTTHPLGEPAFTAEVSDDLGMGGADLVYSRGVDPDAPAIRIPLKLSPGKGELTMLLEQLSPQVQPGDMLTCYLECRDLKGQTAVSEMVLITVAPFDAWVTWLSAHEHQMHEQFQFPPVLAATWLLHSQKDLLPPADFNRQTEELAGSMVDPQTKAINAYVRMHGLSGEAMEHAKRAVVLIARGQKELSGHATARSIGNFRAALGEMAAAGLKDVVAVHAPSPATGNAENEMKQLNAAAQTRTPTAPPPAAKPEKEKTSDQTAELQKQQENLVQQLKAQAKAADAKAPAAAAAQKAGNAQAAQQKAIADKAQATAQQLKAQPNAKATAEKLDNAVRTMHEAAAAMDKGNQDKGMQKAEEAARQLTSIVADLKGNSQDDIGRLLDQTERVARQAKQEQTEIRKKTQTLAADLQNRDPDARQQHDLKQMTVQQVQLSVKVEQVGKMLEQLKEISANGQLKAETTKQVDEANLQMKRTRAAQKSANAAVELAANHPDTAAAEQQKTEAGLDKVLNAVRAANDARATGHEAELKRAKGEADRIKEAVAQAAGKANPPAARTEATAQAVDEAQRLTRHLNQRDLARGDAQTQKDAKRLEELVGNAAAVQAQLEKDPKTSEFAQVTDRLQNKLEAEYQAMLAAKSLFASQREECPPEYRQMVNQYFEALSTQK